MSAEKTGKKYQNYTIISIYLTIYDYTFLFLNSLHVFLLWSENYNFLVYDFCLPGQPFISPFRSCENWGSENDLLRGVLLVNSRARNSNLGRADSEPWAESGPGVKVWLGLGALFWAPGSLLPAPSAGVSLGLPPLVLGSRGVSFSFSPLWGQSAICPGAKDKLPKDHTHFISWAGKQPSSVEAINLRGVNLAALPSWQWGGQQGPVSQRMQAQLQKGFCLRLGPSPEWHSSVEAASPLMRGAPAGQGGKECEARLSSREERVWEQNLPFGGPGVLGPCQQVLQAWEEKPRPDSYCPETWTTRLAVFC